jgi:hypothetical protein
VACCAGPAAAQGALPTRHTVDQWLVQNANAKPDFKPGDVLNSKDLERVRPFMVPGYFDQLNFPELKMENRGVAQPYAAQGLRRLHREVPGTGEA